MNNAKNQVESGVKLSKDAGETLNNTVSSMDNLHSMIQQIVAAIEEMNATTEEIARDVEEISNVTKEFRESWEHTSLASVDLSKFVLSQGMIEGIWKHFLKKYHSTLKNFS